MSESARMDWKGMFVYDSANRTVRIRGWFDPTIRAQEAKVMWQRKRNYLIWYRTGRYP